MVHTVGKVIAIFGVFLLFFLRDVYSHRYLESFRQLPRYSISWPKERVFSAPFWLNVQVQDELGYSFLFYAIEKSDLFSLKYFLSRGSSPNIRNIFGQTPSHIAATYGQVYSIRILSNFGANLNLRDDYQKTPIFYATQRGSLDCVRNLVNLGATPSFRDHDGRTALDHALSHNYRDIVLYFLGRTSSGGVQKAENTISYLDHWEKKYAPLFRIRPLFSYGVSYYLCARFGALFFLEQERQDTEYHLAQGRKRKNPQAIFRWLPMEWP